jgi:hypothetical protein
VFEAGDAALRCCRCLVARTKSDCNLAALKSSAQYGAQLKELNYVHIIYKIELLLVIRIMKDRYLPVKRQDYSSITPMALTRLNHGMNLPVGRNFTMLNVIVQPHLLLL